MGHVSKIVVVCLIVSSHNFLCQAGLPKVEWTDDQNIAYFNHSCHPTTGHPIPCICPAGLVYLPQSDTCWTIPTDVYHPCAHDVQCQAGKWGHYSRCNKRTSRCECYADPLKHGRRLAYWSAEGGGKCLFRNPVDLCRSDWDCKRLIGDGSICIFEPLPVSNYLPGTNSVLESTSLHGSCQCRRETHIWWPPLQYCLPFARKPGDQCQINEQCTEGSLGVYSKCGGVRGSKCECQPIGRTRYYAKTGECFVEKQLNEECESGDQCRASLGEGVECDSRETGDPLRKVCRVKQVGDGCNDNEECSIDRKRFPLFCNKNVLAGNWNSTGGMHFKGKCETYREEWDEYYYGGCTQVHHSSNFISFMALIVIIVSVQLCPRTY